VYYGVFAEMGSLKKRNIYEIFILDLDQVLAISEKANYFQSAHFVYVLLWVSYKAANGQTGIFICGFCEID